MDDTATSVPVSEMTPAAVDAEIQSVMADTDHAYWSLNDPALYRQHHADKLEGANDKAA